MVTTPSKKVLEADPCWSFLGKSKVERLLAPDITKAEPSMFADWVIRSKASRSAPMLNFSYFDT